MLVFIGFYFVIITRGYCVRQSLPEVDMDASDVILYYGYPCENHEITTGDNYILSLQRIPIGLQVNSKKERKAVFLQHGLGDSSFTWVANGPNKSLAFILADNGFDVWLGNTRGNVYSNKHKLYKNTSTNYWDFTWDDMVTFDLPAMINYVLSVSKTEKLGYIGHSQGTEIAFAKLSENSTFNSKISAFVALAPVVYLGHLKTAIKYLAGFAGGLNALMNAFTHGEFLPNNKLLQAMTKFICGDKVGSVICGNVAFLMQGFNENNLNFTRIAVYVAHVPAGTSSKNMEHYAQSYLSNEFQKYDYGYLGNIVKYHSPHPPKYQVNTNGVPVAMFWGGNDWLAVPEDVTRAINELGDNVKFRKFIPEYNHIDFIWGINAAEVVYPNIIEFLNKY